MKRIAFVLAAVLAAFQIQAREDLAGQLVAFVREQGGEQTVRKAEGYLQRDWTPILASDYFKFAGTGGGDLWLKDSLNREALKTMVAAEIIEGKGRFLERIADYAWLETTRPSWCYPGELLLPEDRRLPAAGDGVLSRGAADNAVLLSAVVCCFRKELDALDPSICRTVSEAVRKNASESSVSVENMRKYFLSIFVTR